MGVVPVAVTKWLSKTIQPWARDALGDAKAPAVLPASDGIEIEEVAAQRPDLIIGVYSGMTKREYQTLSKLARRSRRRPTSPATARTSARRRRWWGQRSASRTRPGA